MSGKPADADIQRGVQRLLDRGTPGGVAVRSEGLRMRVWVRALAYAEVDAGRTGVCVCYLLFTIQLHAVAQQLQKIQTKEGDKRDGARKGVPERGGEKERGKKTKGKKRRDTA